MGVPKRKTSKSRRNNRRSHHGAKENHSKKCTKCGADIMPHRICAKCGTYNK